MLFKIPLVLLCGLLASFSVATAKQGVPGAQVMAIGHMPDVGRAMPSNPNLPAAITARAEATFNVPPSSSRDAHWSFRLSQEFMAEMYRLGNELCDKEGLLKRDPIFQMGCSPQKLAPTDVGLLRKGIVSYAYHEVAFDRVAIEGWELGGKYNDEQLRFAAATVLEFAVIEKLLETGGILDETLDLEPVVASSWMTSALVSQTEPGRYWDAAHSTATSSSSEFIGPITSSASTTYDPPSKTTSDHGDKPGSISIDERESTTSNKCPMCTNQACMISPDDDQGQDGTNVPIRPPLVTGGSDPACIPIQDAQNNNKEWFCLCSQDEGKFSSKSTSWATYLSDRGSTTTLVSAACARTDIPAAQSPNPQDSPDVVTRTGEPACIPMQDAQKGSENQEWICMCKKPNGKFASHTTSWTTYRADLGTTTALVSTACPSVEPSGTPIPETQISKATCGVTNVPPMSASPYGAEETVLASAISSFCQHYSSLNLHHYTIQRYLGDPPQDNPWNGKIRTKDSVFPTPMVYNGIGADRRTIIVVRLSIKYEHKACDDPDKPVQSAFNKDSGNWCSAEMYRVVQQCTSIFPLRHCSTTCQRVFTNMCPLLLGHPFTIDGGGGQAYYPGGEVYAGCIKFGVQLA